MLLGLAGLVLVACAGSSVEEPSQETHLDACGWQLAGAMRNDRTDESVRLCETCEQVRSIDPRVMLRSAAWDAISPACSLDAVSCASLGCETNPLVAGQSAEVWTSPEFVGDWHAAVTVEECPRYPDDAVPALCYLSPYK